LTIDGLDAQELASPVFVALNQRVRFEKREIRRLLILVIVRRDFGEIWKAKELGSFCTRYNLHLARIVRRELAKTQMILVTGQRLWI
jgi:hypothetical protein